MDRESFLETIKKQYADEIHEAFLECEHDDGRRIDYPKLNARLKRLFTNAKAEGLSVKDFHDLVHSTMPGYEDKVDYQSSPGPAAAKKAA